MTIKRLSLSAFFIILTLSIGLVSVNLTLSSYAQNSASSQIGKGDSKVEQLRSELHSSNQDNQVVSGDSSALSGNNMMLLTTDDILLDMKGLMNGQLFSQTAEVMRISDAVKFAKYVPAQDDALRSMEQIRQTIDELNRQKQ